jgi:uncharacterized protein
MSYRFSAIFLVCVACLLFSSCRGQQITFEEYEPKSSLVVPQHPVTKAKYPFIDVHNHQNGEMPKEELDKLVKEMDGINLQTMVNLSGGQGEKLQKGLQNMKGNYPQRFILFANIDFTNIDDPDFGRKAAEQLERDVKNGAQGLKIFKNLGLTVKYKNGTRMPVDDSRLDPIWQKCADLNIPVLIHSGEPRQFFDPIDKNNERWLELKQFPTRARPPKQYPSWEQVMSEQHRLFAKHSKTIFINAHLGWLGGDLEQLGKLMDQLPNMYTEIGAVLAELGRQPKFARQWMIKYQDRVLFGKDAWNAAEYHVYFRVLETGDEYFDYYRKRHAFWKMYGLELPDEVLKKIYYKNALRIIPGIDASGFTS